MPAIGLVKVLSLCTISTTTSSTPSAEKVIFAFREVVTSTLAVYPTDNISFPPSVFGSSIQSSSVEALHTKFVAIFSLNIPGKLPT